MMYERVQFRPRPRDVEIGLRLFSDPLPGPPAISLAIDK